MTRTVVALYDDIHHARECVKDLVERGFDRDKISLVAQDPKGEYKQHIEGRSSKDDDIIADTGKGAGIGAILGGLAGLVVGLGALAIPGIGPIVAAGPIASALAGAGIGAATGGVVGALTNLGIPEEQAKTYAEGIRHGGVLVTAQVPDNRVNDAIHILDRHNPIDVTERRKQWMQGGQVQTPDLHSRTEQRHTTGDHETFEVIEEDLKVGKREVDKGSVRVNKTVSERPVEEDITLHDEKVEVQRRQVDRPLTGADRDAFRNETFEIEEHTEEPVVRKDARVVEEVDVSKDVHERKETIRDTVRRTDVEVERTGSGGTTEHYDEFEPMWRNHFQTNYTHTRSSYDDYAPAYHYGYDLHTSDRYQGRSWNEIEPDVRRDFEHRYPKQNWNEYKEAVRQGYSISTSRR